MKPNPPSTGPRDGFSLVEVTLALGVAAFCLVAIIGMIPVGLTSSQNAAAQTAASSVLSAVAADLRNIPLPTAAVPTPSSPYYGFKVPDTTGTTLYVSETGSIVPAAQARFRVTVATVYQPAAGVRQASLERVLISWPAVAGANPIGTVESIVGLDRN